jgi:hypothetical protein
MNETLLSERRDTVIDRLSSGYAQGQFEVEELERRLARAHAAQTSTELDALVTDLAPSSALVPAAATMALVPTQHTRVIFGSIERTGPWAVPQRLTARVLCGHLLLDLREARLSSGETTIDVQVTMGNLEVIVPPGVEVDVSASSVLGNAEDRVERRAAAGGPIVRIVGRVRLGNLEVETRRAGETRRDARWRRRTERRARRRWQRTWTW